jgi:hypothetical protein
LSPLFLKRQSPSKFLPLIENIERRPANTLRKIAMTPQTFITKWQTGGSADALTERAGAQAHFLDLCELLGQPKPADPENYCFERGAHRTGGNHGWADVWKRDCFAWEYKAPGANLEKPSSS